MPRASPQSLQTLLTIRLQPPPEEQYAGLAQAVAALPFPTITAVVDRAIAARIMQLRKELGDHVRRLSDIEHHVSDLDDKMQNSFTTEGQSKQVQQFIFDKLDDLENRFRRNNPWVIGLPESYNVDSLADICSTHIPCTLGISSPFTVERAHQLGAPSKDRCTPRPVIVRFLNYADRVNILKSFSNSKSLQLDSYKLLSFADYSQEVSRRCKASQPICAALLQKGVKFTLVNPAILRLSDPAGDPKTHSHPEKAMQYLQALLYIPMDTSAPLTPLALPIRETSATRGKTRLRKCDFLIHLARNKIS